MTGFQESQCIFSRCKKPKRHTSLVVESCFRSDLSFVYCNLDGLDADASLGQSTKIKKTPPNYGLRLQGGFPRAKHGECLWASKNCCAPLNSSAKGADTAEHICYATIGHTNERRNALMRG